MRNPLIASFCVGFSMGVFLGVMLGTGASWHWWGYVGGAYLFIISGLFSRFDSLLWTRDSPNSVSDGQQADSDSGQW